MADADADGGEHVAPNTISVCILNILLGRLLLITNYSSWNVLQEKFFTKRSYYTLSPLKRSMKGTW